jgi:hypothetical protein
LFVVGGGEVVRTEITGAALGFARTTNRPAPPPSARSSFVASSRVRFGSPIQRREKMYDMVAVRK